MALKTSEEIAALCEAFAKAQALFPAVKRDQKVEVRSKKDGVRPYTYHYANLGSVMAAVAKPLSSNGLCVAQGIEQADSKVRVTTRLLHASGQWMENCVTIPYGGGNNPAQAIGSAITYAKRYGLSALLGVVTDEDDDGMGIDVPEKPAKKPPPKKDPPKKDSQHDREIASQIAHIRGLCTELKEKINDDDKVRSACAGIKGDLDQTKLPFWKKMHAALAAIAPKGDQPPELTPKGVMLMAQDAGETREVVDAYTMAQWGCVLADCDQKQLTHLVNMYTAIIEGQRGE